MKNKNLILIGVLIIGIILIGGCVDSGEVKPTEATAIEKNDTVYISYVGKFENGTVFDKRNLSFIVGTGMIPNTRDSTVIDNSLLGMKEGEEKTITIPPEKAYGPYDHEKVVDVEKVTILPRFINLSAENYTKGMGKAPVNGDTFKIPGVMWDVKVATVVEDLVFIDLAPPEKTFPDPIIGERIVTLHANEIILSLRYDIEIAEGKIIRTRQGNAVVSMVNETTIVLDFNHPFAGKTLIFEIKIEDILEENETPPEPAPNPPPELLPAAKVTLILYSDFHCSHCAKAVPVMDEIKETYGNDVEIIFKQFPLSEREDAKKAAEASECARDQGKFWEYHDKLFANQNALSVDGLKQYALDIGLDIEKFDKCLDSGEKAAKVMSDIREGEGMGVIGTPVVFIDDYKLTGVQPFETFKKIIDAKLSGNELELSDLQPQTYESEFEYSPDTAPEGGFASFRFNNPGADICVVDGKPVIFLFTTTGCSHCNWIRSTFDKVAKEYADAGKIAAYHWELNTNDDALTAEHEILIPESHNAVYKTFNPRGTVPTYVFGCKYYRVGNVYESRQDGLVLAEKEFREVIEHLINSTV